jgi:hypothetical protein
MVSLRLLEDKGWLDLAGKRYAFARSFPRRGEARVGGIERVVSPGYT